MEMTSLPAKNVSGYYEMRLESIGGLGANLCGKMLGELGLKYLGLNSASFSSYGSEKTGTPVKAYIRYCDAWKEIRVHAPVEHPHLLAIFHQALLGKGNVLSGCTEHTKIVLHTSLSCEEASRQYGIAPAQLYCVPAQKIAMECHARINVVMLGAIGKVMGFVDVEQLCELCVDALGKKYPDALAGNLEGIRRGFSEVKGAGQLKNIEQSICAEQQNKTEQSRHAEQSDHAIKQPVMRVNHITANPEPQYGYKTAPIGGINLNYGNSVLADLSPSRQGYLPLFLPEKCINCALCDSTCPDFVFQFALGEYKGKKMMVNQGLDYYHCKGCLRCVEICPTHALVTEKEENCPKPEHFVPNQELLFEPESYDKMGANGYITSESYLTVKREEGGEV